MVVKEGHDLAHDVTALPPNQQEQRARPAFFIPPSLSLCSRLVGGVT